MEKKNSKSSNRNPVCEKLLKAFAGHPSFRKFRRPPSNRQQAAAEVNPSAPTHSAKKELDPSYSPQIHEHEENKIRQMEKEGKHMGGKEDINDVFSSYISRARLKLRSMSSKGLLDSGKKIKKEKESLKDKHFSDYISRAKNRLRATSSSVGFGKGSLDMKRE